MYSNQKCPLEQYNSIEGVFKINCGSSEVRMAGIIQYICDISTLFIFGLVRF